MSTNPTMMDQVKQITYTYEQRIKVMQISYDRSERLRHTQEVKQIETELLLRHAVMELEQQGTLDFLLIKDPALRTWWEENK